MYAYIFQIDTRQPLEFLFYEYFNIRSLMVANITKLFLHFFPLFEMRCIIPNNIV